MKINQKLKNYLLEFGYTQEGIKVIINTYPNNHLQSKTLLLNINTINRYFKELGYTQEEIIKMTTKLPVIYSYSIENIKQKFKDLMSLGYTQEEVIMMTKALSSLLILSMETIKEKIEYLKEIHLESIVLLDTKKLMQSTELTYARYQYFKNLGIEINENNHEILFLAEATFKKIYGITKQEIISIYPYKEPRKRLLKEGE